MNLSINCMIKQLMKKNSAYVLMVPGFILLLFFLMLPLCSTLWPTVFDNGFSLDQYISFFHDRSLFKAEEIVKLATIEGAKALKMDQLIGSLEVGKQADLVLVETDSINMFPIYVPYSALVYSANASNVDSVWIAGTCVLQNKQTVHDQKAIKDALVKAMATFKMRAIERSLEL